MKDTSKKIISEKAKYDMELRKKLEKKQFNTDLSKEEYQKLDNLLKEKGLSKVLFIRLATEQLQNNNLKITTFDNIINFLTNKKITLDKEELDNFRFYISKNNIKQTKIKFNTIEIKYITCQNNLFADIEIIDTLLNKYYRGTYTVDTLNKLLHIIKK